MRAATLVWVITFPLCLIFWFGGRLLVEGIEDRKREQEARKSAEEREELLKEVGKDPTYRVFVEALARSVNVRLPPIPEYFSEDSGQQNKSPPGILSQP